MSSDVPEYRVRAAFIPGSYWVRAGFIPAEDRFHTG